MRCIDIQPNSILYIIHIKKHTQLTHAHANAHVRTHTHTHILTHTYTHTHLQTHTHAHTQIHTYTYTHTHTHTCTQTHTHAHTRTHTHTHTHIHTHIFIHGVYWLRISMSCILHIFVYSPAVTILLVGHQKTRLYVSQSSNSIFSLNLAKLLASAH